MKILLVGSGGREHALALGLKADKSCTELHVAPGNPGIAAIAPIHPLVITDNGAICALAQQLGVLVVVVGMTHLLHAMQYALTDLQISS